ncbi:O-antigen ligase family protein [Bacillus niameyensis]|uniref:O-antigen ligase family protein n=1 Tax=Bacillus niameyensis TaxID=1522308 RepID=UPI0007812FCF|nr:O-antigen ligase family protein [Bacillus niameyensis]
MVKKNYIIPLFIQLLFLSLFFGNFNLDVGFAIKPYMVVTCLIILFFSRVLTFTKLLHFEWLMLLYILIYILTALNFNYPIAHLRYIFAFILIILFYFASRGLIYKCDINTIEKILSNVGVIGGFFSLVYYFLGLLKVNFNFHGNGVSYFGMLLDRSIPRLTGTAASDPNIFVFFATFYFFYFLCNLNSNKNKLGFLFIAISIVCTFSRGAYLSIVIGILIYFLLGIGKGKKKYYINTLILLPILYFVFSKLGDFFRIDLLDMIIRRFENIASDGGSGRVELWKDAYNTFMENPLFGIGINSTFEYNGMYYGHSNYVHNTVLEVLSESGIIGFCFFTLLWLSIFYSCIKLYKNRKSKLFLVIFLSMFIQMFFLSIQLSEAFFMVILLLYRYNQKDETAVTKKE